MKKITLLDCTLRDGAYVVNANFGKNAIKGIIKKAQDANVELIECGWLKNDEHKEGTSFFHVPSDLEMYLTEKSSKVTYVVMIDWDRYDLNYLPECDGKSVDAIRVVFPYEKFREGLAVGKEIQKKGYEVYYQAANTLAYKDEDLIELAKEVNSINPVGLSVVDTFGAMYKEDLEHIISILHEHLNPEIKLGFHSHNNQQLSFALTMDFVEYFSNTERGIVVDASLCGMGRGAGNATTELVANYLNLKHHCDYDMNAIMDAIDIYMTGFQENFEWGYSTPYFIAGMYCCHVNNIAYLLNNHCTCAKDMRNIIESLSPADRKKYDYDLLEEKYLENQNRIVDDEKTIETLKKELTDRPVLLVAPGKSVLTEKEKIDQYIKENNPIILGVNAVNTEYSYDYLILTNSVRYQYAKDIYTNIFNNTKKIVLSNIKTEQEDNEVIINFNHVIKRGWEHFDNAVICTLRLLSKLNISNIAIAGFDGFKTKYNESYADENLPSLNIDGKWELLNEEIKDMYSDFVKSLDDDVKIVFVTPSIFNN